MEKGAMYMGKYTLESLKQLNIIYDRRYEITPYDVETVNEMIELIENSRDQETPALGDIVRFRKQIGEPFELAHIERIKGEELHICENLDPLLLSVSLYGNLSTITMNRNGQHIPNQLKFLRKTSKAFQMIGHINERETGKIKFYADVNMWELCEMNSYIIDSNVSEYCSMQV